MLPRLASLARLLRARPTALSHSPHTHRDLGMDDWQGSIGTSRPDLLWPLVATRQDNHSHGPVLRSARAGHA